MESKTILGALAISALTVAGLLAAPLTAQAVVEQPTGVSDEVGSYLIIPFSAGVPIEQAAGIAESQSEDTAGYRIDNGDVVGEYFLASDYSLEEFEATFVQKYGTQPRVVGKLVERPQSAPDETVSARISTTEVIETGLPDFQPSPVPQSNAEGIRADIGDGTASGPAPRGAFSLWAPENVYAKVLRSGTHQYFTTQTMWHSATPTQIDGYLGMEVGIDLYNGATGKRGSVIPGEICGPNFRDQFIAKNYNWYSWTVFSPNGSLSSTQPYADLNDLLDSCGRNAMAIGFRYPQNIPLNMGAELHTSIDARVGTTNTSKIGAGVQLVDNVNCVGWAGALTDCMGTGMMVGGSRLFLSTTNGWSASPQKCWSSPSQGSVKPTEKVCPE